jgi:predicted PolB exonuclease-like 3'-5' exonuclease
VSTLVKLNEVCSVFGLPGKFGVDGSKVSKMINQGKIQEVRDYYKTDILNTYLVYLRFMMHGVTLIWMVITGRIGRDYND